MAHVLLVEDDVEIARIIKCHLSFTDNYEVTWVKNAEEAMDESHDWYDIILLDIMLPDENGITLCERLRKHHRCPILFISCLDDSSTIISALEKGGDDYIVKPFDNDVLNARIQANLRRANMVYDEGPEKILECQGFSLDISTHELIRQGVRRQLTPMEFRILSFLIRNPNQCFQSGDLYKLLWGKSSYGDNRTVVVHIHSLRRKIEDNPSKPVYLKSIWGKGYMFDPEGLPYG